MAIRLATSNAEDSQPPYRVDDVESFVHVLAWMALRYTSHGLSTKKLSSQIGTIFDTLIQESDGNYAGPAKQMYLNCSDWPEMVRLKNMGICATINTLFVYISSRYSHLGEEKDSIVLLTGEIFSNKARIDRMKRALHTLESDDTLLPTILSSAIDEPQLWATENQKVYHELVPYYAVERRNKTTDSDLISVPSKRSRSA